MAVTSELELSSGRSALGLACIYRSLVHDTEHSPQARGTGATSSKMFGPVARRSGWRLLLILGLCFNACGPAADCFSTEFEASPLQQDPSQAEWLRQKAKETQDQYRLRVSIPRTVEEGSIGTDSPTRAPSVEILAESAGERVLDLFLGALLCLGGLLILRRLAPEATETILERLFPWRSDYFLHPELSAEAIMEDRAFAEFLVSFKAGPALRSNSRKSVEGAAACEKGNNSAAHINPLKLLPPHMRAHLLAMRDLLLGIQAGAKETQRPLLEELWSELRGLKEMAANPEFLPVWQLVSALAGLVGQLTQRASDVTPNILRTIASGLDLLADLCQQGFRADLTTKPAIRLLAVDDDPISRHAVDFALKKAFDRVDVAANGEAALAQASAIAYDVIFLDILMPGMDGFDLCSSIRQTDINRDTPAVFITSQNDFDTRAKSSLSGGNDFITKPFLAFEVTVKALVHALRARLAKRKVKSPAVPLDRVVPAPASV